MLSPHCWKICHYTLIPMPKQSMINFHASIDHLHWKGKTSLRLEQGDVRYERWQLFSHIVSTADNFGKHFGHMQTSI